MNVLASQLKAEYADIESILEKNTDTIMDYYHQVIEDDQFQKCSEAENHNEDEKRQSACCLVAVCLLSESGFTKPIQFNPQDEPLVEEIANIICCTVLLEDMVQKDLLTKFKKEGEWHFSLSAKGETVAKNLIK